MLRAAAVCTAEVLLLGLTPREMGCMNLTLEAVGEAHCVPIAWREVFPAPLHPLCCFLLPLLLQGLMSGYGSKQSSSCGSAPVSRKSGSSLTVVRAPF